MKEYPVYPGEYTPMPEVEALLEELKTPHKDSSAKPLVNMNECKDLFTIEVVVPGVRREEIYIHVHNNVLSIVVLHKDCVESKKEKLQIHEFDTECLERHILLPDNADTEFVSAKYREGILSLHIPKTHEPSKTYTNQIVVY
jgi:HSP20 family protein